MNLLQALQQTTCDVLRARLEEFIQATARNLIKTSFCPVCHADLRGSYKDQDNQDKYPGQGSCRVCALAIQMRHDIIHEGHMLNAATKELCAFRVTLPVSLCCDVTLKLLRDKWLEMRMPCRPLTKEEFGNWVEAAHALVKKITVN
jgi:hypothetical protein